MYYSSRQFQRGQCITPRYNYNESKVVRVQTDYLESRRRPTEHQREHKASSMSTGCYVGTRSRDQELEALKAKIEHLENSRVRPALERTNTNQVEVPFSESIIEDDFPYHFKAPTIDTYDGRVNLEDHLTTFECHMNILGVGQLARCKLFSIYLFRVAAR